ncbi:hypothetical protein PR001_g493 [Phytophthora rubi]|uniref:Uncharacterized protein n=1 Tax=Phytophthora rubi TaxID=129364 RepID=A0A6A3PID7_9STRA|nr:hypothetical protein PR001_g493 [Phytophthora rubi]
MLRRATLQLRGYIFLQPEHVDGLTEYPFYASVTALTSETATIRSLGLDDPITCNIDTDMARTLTVSKVEATRTRQRQLLRQAAWTESAARFWHGQVVGMDGRLARLQLEDLVVLVKPARLTPVAPVVALLLFRVPLHASMTRDGLTDMQTTILARILDGTDGAPASNDIPTILDGLVQPSDMPAGRWTRSWIDSRTGNPCTFQLQNVVDYARLCTESGLSEQQAVTNYCKRLHLSLADTVRQRRGELGNDPRPNKGLDPYRLQFVLQGYHYTTELVAIARSGIVPTWKVELPQARTPPKNHNSARLFKKALLRSIRQCQADGTYLAVSLSLLEQWKNIQCSPFGAVEKKGVNPLVEVRPIPDLSHPNTASTNAYFDTTCLPDINYISVVAIARRTEELVRTHPGAAINILKGDVKRAYRHLMLHAEHVCWMGATFPDEDALVIDLAAPFVWSGSPAFYSAFGRAISWLVSVNSPASVSDSSDNEAFFGYEWVDNHILVEPDRESRLELAEATLRLSMMAVRGPDSINDSKFSSWSTEQQALGLIWNTVDRNVTMPPDKIQKSLDRVSVLLASPKVNKHQLQQLIGSLRHITTCFRSAKPFFQKLQSVCNRLRPFQSVQLSEASRRDLRWFHYILSHGHLDKLPLRFFGDLPKPTVNFYMDASNTGLAVLHPARDEFIQLQFDEEELQLIADAEATGFSINARSRALLHGTRSLVYIDSLVVLSRTRCMVPREPSPLTIWTALCERNPVDHVHAAQDIVKDDDDDEGYNPMEDLDHGIDDKDGLACAGSPPLKVAVDDTSPARSATLAKSVPEEATGSTTLTTSVTDGVAVSASFM